MQDVSVVYPLHSFQSQLEPSTRALKVWKIQWWMAHYGSRTPKRHVGYSNCACIGSLDRGRLPKRVMKKLKKKTSTTRVYVNGRGQVCYCGNKNLKQTQ